MKLFIYKPALTACFTAVLWCGCGNYSAQESAKEEQKIREVATVYRDAYMSGFSTLSAGETFTNLSQGSIRSVEKLSNGWLVIFSAPDVRNDAKLTEIHVYIKPSGELDRIVSK